LGAGSLARTIINATTSAAAALLTKIRIVIVEASMFETAELLLHPAVNGCQHKQGQRDFRRQIATPSKGAAQLIRSQSALTVRRERLSKAASMDPTSPINIPPQRPNWWGRNWKWFVPTGCLGILVVLGTFVCLILLVVFGAMKSSDVYETAFATASTDPKVTSALGLPIEAGYFVSGKTDVSGSSGEADMAVPISGPNGKGTIYFVASKFAGEWTFSKLVVEVGKTGEEINLIDKVPRTEP
jgi:hypothetical protein